MHRTRNAAYGQPYRGFESLPLRHYAEILYNTPLFARLHANTRNERRASLKLTDAVRLVANIGTIRRILIDNRIALM